MSEKSGMAAVAKKASRVLRVCDLVVVTSQRCDEWLARVVVVSVDGRRAIVESMEGHDRGEQYTVCTASVVVVPDQATIRRRAAAIRRRWFLPRRKK